MWWPFVQRGARRSVAHLLAQLPQFALERVNLLLLACHHGVQLFDLVFEEAGFDFKLGEAGIGHRGLGGVRG